MMPSLILLLVLPASIARANPWSLFGFGPRARGLAGAHTAAARDFSGIHYNPSSLTEVTHSGFGFNVSTIEHDLSLDFDRAEGGAEALSPDSAPGVAFGAQFLLGEPGVGGRAGLAIGFHIPTGSLLSGQALDPSVPQWYMHQSLARRIVSGLGVGWAPWDWLSVGASLQILAGVSGRLDYELDIVAGRFAQKSVVFDVEPTTAPSFGLELRPLDGLRLGATYRTGISGKADLPINLEVTGLSTVLITTELSFQYMPHELALGASYVIPDLGTLLAADLVWQGWSAAPDPSPRTALQASGGLVEGTGLDNALDAPAPGQARAVDLGFQDVFVVAVGAEQPLGPVSFRLGYAFRPTPAPRQTSGTNYVDSTAHVLAGGLGVRFRDPTGILEGPIVVDVSATAWLLASRRHDKIAGNDPVGGFEAGGAIYTFAAGFRYEFDAAPLP